MAKWREYLLLVAPAPLLSAHPLLLFLPPALSRTVSGFWHVCEYSVPGTLKISGQQPLYPLRLWCTIYPWEERLREEAARAGQCRVCIIQRKVQDGGCRLWRKTAHGPWPVASLSQRKTCGGTRARAETQGV